jgi:hypothetical protein
LLENDPSAADSWLDEEDDRKFQKESKKTIQFVVDIMNEIQHKGNKESRVVSIWKASTWKKRGQSLAVAIME